MKFHPDRLLPANASKPVRIAYWTAKYLVSVALGYVVVLGIAALFESPIVTKALGAAGIVAVIAVGHWLWRSAK